MDIHLKTEYWHSQESREAFKTFILDIHGLDFNEWESRGYWDDAYTPFSYFKDGEIIASVCIYLLDAIVAGNKTKLVQISGVGTHQNWRRQGLSRKLTDIGLEWAKDKHSGIFLFADKEAIPYYEYCGFSPIKETLEYYPIEPMPSKRGLYCLDPGDQKELDQIYTYASNRTPISDKFSIFNSKLLMFHALYTIRDNIYMIPDLECLVFFHRAGEVVNIYDIVGRKIPAFDEIYPYISANTDRRIHFHFHTDKLGIKGIRTKTTTGNNTFVKGSFPVSEPSFPFTSRA